MSSKCLISASPGEVFKAFLVLGLTSFGGPVAHLGYFRREFVQRRGWLGEAAYADLVALCQCLPGPASSQVGMALGLMRAGWRGAALAWLAFTLPSAALMVALALGATRLDGPIGQGLVHGLKLTAVAVVAHAVWGMARSLCPDRLRITVALVAIFMVGLIQGTWGQVGAILMGGLIGGLICRPAPATPEAVAQSPVSRRAGGVAAAGFVGLLCGLPLLAWGLPSATTAMVDAFYRAGALVFGGGHVVLPLLETATVATGEVTRDAFLTGYGAAQAIPGPLFTFAAYLGTLLSPFSALPDPLGALAAAGLALLVVFLPGTLLLVAVWPWWQRFQQWSAARAFLMGANAAVVGILAAALYQPVASRALTGPLDFAMALTGILLLGVWKLPAWAVVIVVTAGGVLLGLWDVRSG